MEGGDISAEGGEFAGPDGCFGEEFGLGEAVEDEGACGVDHPVGGADVAVDYAGCSVEELDDFCHFQGVFNELISRQNRMYDLLSIRVYRSCLQKVL